MKKIELSLTLREAEVVLRAMKEECRFLKEMPKKKDGDISQELNLAEKVYSKIRFQIRGVK